VICEEIIQAEKTRQRKVEVFVEMLKEELGEL